MTKKTTSSAQANMRIADVRAASSIGDGAAFTCRLMRGEASVALVEYRGDGGTYLFSWKRPDGSFLRNGRMPDDVRKWADSRRDAWPQGHPLYDENINSLVARLVDAALSDVAA